MISQSDNAACVNVPRDDHALFESFYCCDKYRVDDSADLAKQLSIQVLVHIREPSGLGILRLTEF